MLSFLFKKAKSVFSEDGFREIHCGLKCDFLLSYED